MAAVKAATGVTLTQKQLISLLVQEGLITRDAAKDHNLIFRGYDEYFRFEEAAARIEPIPQLLDADYDQEETDA